jgi:hypothetical protein
LCLTEEFGDPMWGSSVLKTYLDELNPERRRALEHDVTEGNTVGRPFLLLPAPDLKTETLDRYSCRTRDGYRE